jgi:prefoldin beta subunit
MDEETSKKINELQILEQGFQSLMMQKQAFQIDFNEVKNALSELENSDGNEVYRVIGSIMIKSAKESLKKELSEKKKILDSKIKALEKQELSVRENIERVRNDVINKLQ